MNLSIVKRRLVVGCLVAGVLTAFAIIVMAGIGFKSPEPALGIASLISSAICLPILAWRSARRHR